MTALMSFTLCGMEESRSVSSITSMLIIHYQGKKSNQRAWRTQFWPLVTSLAIPYWKWASNSYSTAILVQMIASFSLKAGVLWGLTVSQERSTTNLLSTWIYPITRISITALRNVKAKWHPNLVQQSLKDLMVKRGNSAELPILARHYQKGIRSPATSCSICSLTETGRQWCGLSSIKKTAPCL